MNFALLAIAVVASRRRRQSRRRRGRRRAVGGTLARGPVCRPPVKGALGGLRVRKHAQAANASVSV